MTAPNKYTRRQTLSLLGQASLAAGLGAGCAGPLRQDPNPRYLALPPAARPGQVLLGMYRGYRHRQILEELLPQVSDLGWLSRGDAVLVKIACNSGNIHPAVTSPGAVAAVVGLLRDRGAGPVYVADQAGVEHVRLTAEGRVGSTRELMARNGLLQAAQAAGAEVVCFDDQGWEGYVRAEMWPGSRWGEGLWLPRMLQQVDHVINLPRLGAHALAGYTCGIKNGVGWLRDDSRRLLHQQGGAFYERLAEIWHAPLLRARLRLTLTLADAVLTNIGPDFGAEVFPPGCLAVAATDLVAHDHLAAALLPWFDRRDLSIYDIYSPYPSGVNLFNRHLVSSTWGAAALAGYEPLVPAPPGGALAHDPCASHLAVLQGSRPDRIAVRLGGGHVPAALREHLRGYGGGVFAV